MTLTKLKLVSETREQRIERALRAMGDVVTDLDLPLPVRKAVWRGYAALHACRSPETVRRLERAIFDRLSPEDQALFLKSGGKL